MISASYRYRVNAIIILENETIEIKNESIVGVTIDSNYDTNNRPIVYITFNIQPRIYDKLVLNSETAYINLRIRKSSNGNSSINKDYIHDNFTYLIKSDPDYVQSLREQFRLKDKNDEDSYVFGTIALFRKDSLDKIKQIHNSVIKDSNMASIIHKYTYDRKMVISSFQSTKNIDYIVIPPMESLTELISFLNEFDALYDRKYRYFEDFDITYLLDSSGRPVHSVDKYDTIIIDVLETTDERTKIAGISIDENSNSYIINVDAQDTSMIIDTAQNIEYDSIIGISSSGEIYKLPLHNSKGKTDKSLVRRIYNDNTRFIDNIKNEMDNISVVLQVNKSEVDGSIFTPNKEYLVNNYKAFKQYNGRVLLSFKKEVLIQQDGKFISSVILGLRKIME